MDEFIQPSIIAGRELRVLGTHENAALICKLWELKLRGGPISIQLAGPLVCESAAERQNPEKALFRMRQCVLPGSVGGWHTMTELDYPTYAIIRQIAVDGSMGEHTRTLTRTHPVWRDLSFIETINLDEVTMLLAMVVDPRFFVDIRHPNRISKLVRYLGLNPRVQQQVYDISVPKKPYHRRYDAVAGCWWRTAMPELTPRNFLWRIAHHHGDVRGELRASQAFVTYLRYTWLHCITPEHATGGEGVFDPTLFFKNKDEVNAYLSYKSRLP
jgi:hypothetical protein